MFIIDKNNWKIVKENKIIGTNYKDKAQLIKKDDLIIVYITRLSLIAGSFRVITVFSDKKKKIEGGVYPYRMTLEPLKIPKKPIDIKSLINELNFIKNKSKWFFHLFGSRGLRKLSELDYNTIYQALQ